MITIISLGGSIVAPDDIDIPYLRAFAAVLREFLTESPERKVILIIGGGGPARRYQHAYRELMGAGSSEDQDWIGIMATRLNAELVRSLFAAECATPVVTDPTAEFDFSGRVLVAAGWKPGFSTDFDAVMLAERFGASRIVNLSNIDKVYSADPRQDPDAVPLDTIDWDKFRELVGTTWTPGKNTPFDPIATRKASELNLQVIAAGGRDLPNLERLLRSREFHGTIIGRSSV
ncbi:UMP kinase [Spirochaeta africana]|uniref:Uridylate kinase n=1 Tax=Spirochaeta africana (strain ATCC 700263 / DSM 8902 / Z-7692) TaxID=889378 RepID=H9UGW1_SPIAZ|nr:UMP kinase [Spirochaeta africana]AFG36754.1 uridylate kinase, putative [Spirochaeta africana DSM 8902]